MKRISSRTKAEEKIKSQDNQTLLRIAQFVLAALIVVVLAFAIKKWMEEDPTNSPSPTPVVLERQKAVQSEPVLGPTYYAYCSTEGNRCSPNATLIGDKSPIFVNEKPYVMPPAHEVPSGILFVPGLKAPSGLDGLPLININYDLSLFSGSGEAFDNILPIIERHNPPPPDLNRTWKNFGVGAALQIAAIDYKADDITLREIAKKPNNKKYGGPDAADLMIVDMTTSWGNCESRGVCIVRK